MERKKDRPEDEHREPTPKDEESKRAKRSRSRERSRPLEPRWQRICDMATD